MLEPKNVVHRATRTLRVFASLALGLFLVGAALSAQDGVPDTTFSLDGFQSAVFRFEEEMLRGVVVQPDGKVVAVGWSRNLGLGRETATVRFTSSGDLDPSFSGDGGDVQSLGFGDDYANDVALQADGKIVVAGCAITDVSYAVLLVRYNTDGTLDTTFGGGDGWLWGPGSNSCAEAVVVQADGKIVVVGSVSANDLFLARFLGDGTPDPLFGGGDGWVAFAWGDGIVGHDLELQSDGKIVAAACANDLGFEHAAVVRFTSSGAADTGFSGDGVALGPAGFDSCAYGLDLLPDGGFVVAGSEESMGTPAALLSKFTAAGTLDSSFGGGDGWTSIDVGLGEDVARDVRVQPDGALVAAGFSLIDVDTSVLSFRVHSDGSLDTSWNGPDGTRTDRIETRPARAFAMTFDDRFRPVIAGTRQFDNGSGDFAVWAVGRYSNTSQAVFADGFESGNANAWSSNVP